jgi:glutaconate CoA-transferase, subunit A
VIKEISLKEAIVEFVHDGDVVALEGFSHLIPFAAGHEIIRQQRRDLTLVRMTPDIIFDQMIGMGCARKVIFSWAGNPGLGLLHRFRDAVEKNWPGPVLLEEHTHASMAAAYAAGAARLPFGILPGSPDTDLLRYTSTVSSMKCPFTGVNMMAVRAINPDVTIIHAQRADRLGNVQVWGVLGVQKEAVYAARRVIVTVEEICDELRPVLNGIVIPSLVTSAIVHAPGGAYPSYVHGYSRRDNAFYQEWDGISRDRGRFTQWMDEHVLECIPA